MKHAYINGIILDGTKDMEPITGKSILVKDGKIEKIVDSQENYEGYEIIDLKGQYIMPGLINMHVHLAGNGKPQTKQRDNEGLVATLLKTPLRRRITYKVVCRYAKLELLGGVTTIRTVGGLANFDSRCRDDIQSGRIVGPRIIASNQGISVPGGHMAGSVAIAATNKDMIKEHILKLKSEGADFAKIMVTGGILDATQKGAPGELKMSPELIRYTCEVAHNHGMMVAAHVESPGGMRVSLENGVDSIEHGAKPNEEIVSLFKEKNAFVCATISPSLPYALFDRSVTKTTEVQYYNGKVVFEGIVDCAKAALANNIPVALGNDVGCPYITQYDFWRELQYFHKYVGVSNQFALHTATLVNARLAGVDQETGSIAEGKYADMIVTKDNPLQDLCALRQLSYVIAKGKVIKNPKFKRNEIVDRELDKFL